ncbi:MAG: adenylyltransferase/cytidyltransferase family protein [Candidatus Paceibacterota bacterium]|jgi:FAD synthetase
MKKVLVFGTFDVIHPGHINFLEQAGKRGDCLAVVVARDSTVKKVKGHLPIKNENERLAEILKTGLTERAFLGNEGGDPYSIINDIRPDVICLGYDQRTYTDGLKDELDRLGLKTEVFRMEPFVPEKYHSGIINRARCES